MFIFAIILFLIALIGLAAAVLGRSREAKGGGTKVFLGAALLGVVFTVIASLSTVPTQNVGIVTQFSKPTGRTTGAGLKWTAPWQDIDDWDASRQMYDRAGSNCLWVNIAAQRRACIPLQVEYASKAERAGDNWAAYKPIGDSSRFETFVYRRVSPTIDALLVSTFASFDPLGNQQVGSKVGQPDQAAPDLNSLYGQKMTAAITGVLAQDVDVYSVRFGTPQYDEKTQGQIDAYGQKILEARNLSVDEQNAQTRARISKIDASVPQQARCLQIAEKLGKDPGPCMWGSATIIRPAG